MEDRFQWYHFIYQFIDKLGYSEQEVLDMEYINCLNWLAYWDNVNELQAAELKKKQKG